MSILGRRLSEATPLAGLGRWVGAIRAGLATARRRAEERDALLAMGERTLKDIGLSKVDAWCAARQPRHWQRSWRPS
jgi:uncharacterized protein YjiS (DUF1127 family)